MRFFRLPGLWFLVYIAGVLSCVCNDANLNCYLSNVFDDCCNRISLEKTGQRVALTAFCPTGYVDSVENPSHVYSRLYLDEISQFDGKNLTFLPFSGTHMDTQ